MESLSPLIFLQHTFLCILQALQHLRHDPDTPYDYDTQSYTTGLAAQPEIISPKLIGLSTPLFNMLLEPTLATVSGMLSHHIFHVHWFSSLNDTGTFDIRRLLAWLCHIDLSMKQPPDTACVGIHLGGRIRQRFGGDEAKKGDWICIASFPSLHVGSHTATNQTKKERRETKWQPRKGHGLGGGLRWHRGTRLILTVSAFSFFLATSTKQTGAPSMKAEMSESGLFHFTGLGLVCDDVLGDV